VPHELDPRVAASLDQVTAGLPERVPVRAADRCWLIPRVYIALHGIRAWEFPAVARWYGFAELPAADSQLE
jgi:hypothetical protein